MGFKLIIIKQPFQEIINSKNQSLPIRIPSHPRPPVGSPGPSPIHKTTNWLLSPR